MLKQVQYVVKETRQETPEVVTLFLTLKTGNTPNFTPGQVINVYFPDTDIPAGKSYSISNAPNEKHLTITIHGIGEFSHRLCKMQPGDTLLASLPYGTFRPSQKNSHLVMLAGGIGITPFRSLIQHAQQKTPTRKISLFYSASSVDELVFHSELTATAKENTYLSTKFFITRQADASHHLNINYQRIEATDLLSQITDLDQAEFLLCGSFSFIQGIKESLHSQDIPNNKITDSCISQRQDLFR